MEEREKRNSGVRKKENNQNLKKILYYHLRKFLRPKNVALCPGDEKKSILMLARERAQKFFLWHMCKEKYRRKFVISFFWVDGLELALYCRF